MKKQDAIDKIFRQKTTASELLKNSHRDQDFKKWYRDTEIAIINIFGDNSRHIKEFNKVSYTLKFFTTDTPSSDFTRAHNSGIDTAITILQSFIDEITEYWDSQEIEENQGTAAFLKVEKIIRRFHQVSRQIRKRYADRSTIEIEDEYDVQDLFHALLRIDFDDIRPEECTPSYAGASSRVDFLLKKERIVIEIKKTRKGLGAKEVGEQLIIDSNKYHSHPDCSHLICFVYDPDGRIANPKGIENDLSKHINSMQVTVFITPNN